MMKKAIKTAVYDDELRLEAYRFDGIMQPFPNHFHEYYVIGLVEKGNGVCHAVIRNIRSAPGICSYLIPATITHVHRLTEVPFPTGVSISQKKSYRNCRWKSPAGKNSPDFRQQ